MLTADLRARIRDQLGPFETGDARWYAWISQRLLQFGMARDTADLLRYFLARPVSPEALIADIGRIGG